MAARNWLECPSCGAQQGVLDQRSQPAGSIGEAECIGCKALNKKPRKAVTLTRAMGWAHEQVGGGATVYLRDIESRKVVTINKHNIERWTITDPDRKVEVCSVR